MSEFTDQLPEALRETPWLKEAQSAEEAHNKLVHAAKLVGTSIRIPDAEADDDTKAAFYSKLAEVEGVTVLPTHEDIEGVVGLLQKLGYPEDHTGYKLPEIPDYEWNESQGETLRQYAHKAGLTPGQFDALAKQFAEQGQVTKAETENQLNEARKAIRMDWGDTLEDRESLIRGWLEHSEAPDSMKNLLKDRKLPLETMNWLHGIAKQFKDNVQPISSDGKGGEPVLTPGEAHEQIQNTLRDMTNMPESDPRYGPLKQKLVTLHKLAKGGEAA